MQVQIPHNCEIVTPDCVNNSELIIESEILQELEEGTDDEFSLFSWFSPE